MLYEVITDREKLAPSIIPDMTGGERRERPVRTGETRMVADDALSAGQEWRRHWKVVIPGFIGIMLISLHGHSLGVRNNFV